VDLAIEWDQVHALLGENGAGKTTLMNVAYGLVRPDSGTILVDGNPVVIHGPQDAIRLGIGMVHQHFMLIPPLTVAENVILGHETVRAGGFVDQRAAEREVRDLSQRYGLEVDPRARIEGLPVGIQQRVEILKSLYRGARILILDEPTAVLTPLEVADTITVMRRGKVEATTRPSETNPAGLARLMVGRPVLLRVDKAPARPQRPVLELDHLVVHDDRRRVAVDGVALSVHAGEIVGIAGVEGNGQNELAEAIAGLRPDRGGRVLLDGQDVTRATTRHVLHGGLGFIPADRHRMGLVLEHSVSDNLVLSTFDRAPFARWIIRRFEAVLEYAQRLIKQFDIRAESPSQPAGSLSGGNQQKVVAARELGRQPRALLASQPTRGLDVGSIEFIHRQIVDQRDAGLAVLLISSELDEILSLADRVAVMYRGRIVAILEGDAIDRERIGLLMAGAA